MSILVGPRDINLRAKLETLRIGSPTGFPHEEEELDKGTTLKLINL